MPSTVSQVTDPVLRECFGLMKPELLWKEVCGAACLGLEGDPQGFLDRARQEGLDDGNGQAEGHLFRLLKYKPEKALEALLRYDPEVGSLLLRLARHQPLSDQENWKLVDVLVSFLGDNPPDQLD